MPKRTDINTILVIGAGPIVIGQACEFDYSGTQACKALREEGYRIVLINSNPATIMTDPETADRTYVEPITPETVEKIIIKESPDAILPTVGGQTALNCALALYDQGILEKYGVHMIGATPDAIDKAENRRRFNEAMAKIGLDVPRNTVVQTLDDAMVALEKVGLPAIIRPSFTLGGTGGGIASTKEEFTEIVLSGLDASPTNEVLIDESILGWKEYEMEVIRDKADNAIIICAIENLDPMGVHTGDSITVAPALTLTDKEYQYLRDASLAVLREIGVETGGSNVQFAVNPEDGRVVVIEMNPRVSRSSALASKATGFPIAKVAAKLAVGYTLDEIKNDITEVTPASFEPSIDYIVTKIPRFTFEKFGEATPKLSSAMRSVGEAMAIGRSFNESLQKALRSMETGLNGLNTPLAVPGYDAEKGDTPENIQSLKKALIALTPDRILRIAEALRIGISKDELHDITRYDPWFIDRLAEIVDAEKAVIRDGIPQDFPGLLALKKEGFSDARLSQLSGVAESDIYDTRCSLGIRPVYKTVDTCAAEFRSYTPYMYGCYEAGSAGVPAVCEANPSDREKVVILGGGPNRIGQGIEFDYACVHASKALAELGYETIMVNCNPETVSTDYDTSDKLYFEPLTDEDVIALIKREQENGKLIGAVVQFGGQTPLKLSRGLEAAGIPVIGTSPDSIDLAEDRERFQQLLHRLNLAQPDNDICYSPSELPETAERLGYPCVIRPSNVLGGRAMEIVFNQEGLREYLVRHQSVLLDGPILVDRFLEDAIEADVDAICDGEDVHVAGVMEHIEEAGVHSGDSACVLPPYGIPPAITDEIVEATVKLAKAIGVVGLMNVQYAVQRGRVFVIEANPRASRTVPFVAKATGVPVAKIAAQVMVGKKLKDINIPQPSKRMYAVKEAVFPFARFENADTLLGPEMKSTGEVMGIDENVHIAFAKAQIGAGNNILVEGNVLFSVRDKDKPAALMLASRLERCGLVICATDGTARYFHENGLPKTVLMNKIAQGGNHVIEQIRGSHVSLLINTDNEPGGDALLIRRAAFMARIPYATTMQAARATVNAITQHYEGTEIKVVALQDLIA